MANTVQPNKTKLLKARDVATILNISQEMVYTYARSGTLPSPVIIGSVYRWRRSDIMAIVGERAQ